MDILGILQIEYVCEVPLYTKQPLSAWRQWQDPPIGEESLGLIRSAWNGKSGFANHKSKND